MITIGKFPGQVVVLRPCNKATLLTFFRNFQGIVVTSTGITTGEAMALVVSFSLPVYFFRSEVVQLDLGTGYPVEYDLNLSFMCYAS
jgi:hypothetical protein